MIHIYFLPIKNISKDALSDILCLGSIMMSAMTSNMYETMCRSFIWSSTRAHSGELTI